MALPLSEVNYASFDQYMHLVNNARAELRFAVAAKIAAQLCNDVTDSIYAFESMVMTSYLNTDGLFEEFREIFLRMTKGKLREHCEMWAMQVEMIFQIVVRTYANIIKQSRDFVDFVLGFGVNTHNDPLLDVVTLQNRVIYEVLEHVGSSKVDTSTSNTIVSRLREANFVCLKIAMTQQECKQFCPWDMQDCDSFSTSLQQKWKWITKKRLRELILAFCLATHDRLGAHSHVKMLCCDEIRSIAGMITA